MPARTVQELDMARQAQAGHPMQDVRHLVACPQGHQGGTGKGKGQGRPAKTDMSRNTTWLDTPPGLDKLKPLKKTKIQKEATELLEPVWSAMSSELQDKLQHLGIGPKKPPEPDLHEMLKTHMASLPAQVQEVVTRLTAPAPVSEQDIAIKLKGQVSDLKNLSMKKTQLQEKPGPN